MFWKWLFALYVTVWVLQGTETFTVAEALADDVDGIAGLSESQVGRCPHEAWVVRRSDVIHLAVGESVFYSQESIA